MTFDCVVNKIRFSLPPNAMLHNTNDSLAPLCALSSTHPTFYPLRIFLAFPHAQQQWKLCSQFSFPMQMCSSSTRLAFFLFRFRAPHQQPPPKTAMLFSFMKKTCLTPTPVQSSPDVIQFELESYNSYSRIRGDFFLCSVLAST